MLNLLSPDNGKVELDGVPVANLGQKQLSDVFAYVHQSPILLDQTIANNMAFGLAEEEVEKEKILNAMELAQVSSWIEKSPGVAGKSVGERGIKLSGGQRQRGWNSVRFIASQKF